MTIADLLEWHRNQAAVNRDALAFCNERASMHGTNKALFAARDNFKQLAELHESAANILSEL